MSVDVVVVHDSTGMAEGIRSIIDRNERFKVRQVHDLECGARLFRPTNPNEIIVLGVGSNRSGLDGPAVVRSATAIYPTIGILAMFNPQNTARFSEMCRAGTMGYLSEDEIGNSLFPALTALSDGQYFISRSFTGRMRTELSLTGSIDVLGLEAGLTKRQREVLTRVVAGEPYKQIGDALGISDSTIECVFR